MQESMILRIAFVDFLKQIEPLVVDPLLIVQSHFKNFTNLLSDNSITTKTIVENIERLKQQPSSEKISTETIISTEPKSQPESQQIPAIPVNKITQPGEKKPTYRRCQSKQNDLNTQKNKTDIVKIIENPQPVKLDSSPIIQVSKPSLTQLPFQFNRFLTVQEDKKFSLVTKEYILDDILLAMREFRRNTKTLYCLIEKTSEVNTSESNEVDKTLENQDYDFSSYMEKQQQHQEQTYNQLRNETGFNILSKYKNIAK